MLALVLLSGQTFGFINKHDRNIVPNRIFELAGMANQTIFMLIVLYVTLTLGAGQNVHQGFIQHVRLH